MSQFDLQGLVASLDEHGVEFIAIGGVAVGAHGFVRATEDLDIVPDPDAANLRRLAEALVDLEATLPTAGDRVFDAESDAAALLRGASVTADTRLGSLDVVQLARGVPPYSQLALDSEQAEILGTPIRVCSLARLRAMKRAQGRALDLADLENLPEE